MIYKGQINSWIAESAKRVGYVYSFNKEVDTGTILISSERQSVWLSRIADNPHRKEAWLFSKLRGKMPAVGFD